MAIIERADAASIPVAKHQPADLPRCVAVLPFGIVELGGFEPHGIDQRTRLPRHAAQQLLLQPLLEIAHDPSPLERLPAHMRRRRILLCSFPSRLKPDSKMLASTFLRRCRCCSLLFFFDVDVRQWRPLMLPCLSHIAASRADARAAGLRRPGGRASTTKLQEPPRLCACAPREQATGAPRRAA